MTHLTTQQPELPTELQQELAIKPGQILEKVAQRYECTLEEVLLALPAEMRQTLDGSHFISIMQDLAEWQNEVTFIGHTPDAVIEVTGKIPTGGTGGGFYNFDHSERGGLHGHLRYKNCKTIYLIDRPFMGKRTVSLNFINSQGESMFKIFVGRNAQKELHAHQIEALYTLFHTLNKETQ